MIENEMNTNDYMIRLEKKEDYRAVESLVRESFWNVYRPGCGDAIGLDMRLYRKRRFSVEMDDRTRRGLRDGTLVFLLPRL